MTTIFFCVDNTQFEISLSKTDKYFSISDITNHENGSSPEMFLGAYQMGRDTMFLVDGQTKMKIVGLTLMGFPLKAEIPLRKVKDRCQEQK